MLDALGNEIILGNWYGYTALGGGFSHTTIGKVKAINEKTEKIRLEKCIVKHYLYGKPTGTPTWRNPTPADVSIRSVMVFPVPRMD